MKPSIVNKNNKKELLETNLNTCQETQNLKLEIVLGLQIKKNTFKRHFFNQSDNSTDPVTYNIIYLIKL